VITHLDPVIAPRDAVRNEPADDHPMRKVTRQVAFDPEGWTPERAAKVVELFDGLADEWNSRDQPGRDDPLVDALDRGEPGRGRCLEVGSATGLATPLLTRAFDAVVAVDLSFPMLAQAPPELAPRVQGDAARLPFPDACFDSIALQNAFLFPREVERLLRPRGTVVWVSSRGPLTPIYLSPEEVAEALPGRWSGVASDAGEGSWCVVRRDQSPS
jgi:SAM-dependent methyltransferase